MRAVVWHGKEDVRVDTVPDPELKRPDDAIVRVTSSAICGSDLHLYSKLSAFLKEGDVIGHEPMGVVEEIGPAVTAIQPGDRVVIPFNVACGRCFMCERGLQSQCETTQQRRWRRGAAVLGYTHLYGGVPGGQAEYVRVPFANYGPIKVPDGPPDERFLFLSDVLPTAWQAVDYADVPPEGTVAVFGLGPIGQMCVRVARHRGAGRVFGIDLVPERLELARRWGAETLDAREGDVASRIRELTDGRGADSVVDAVGMEADGGPVARLLQTLKLKPDVYSALRPAALSLRRGGTLSVAGVYVGVLPLVPIGEVFDRQFAIRIGQANVRRWTEDLLPLLTDDDPLGTGDLTTHRLPLEDAPRAYELFQRKLDGCIKVVLRP